MCSPCMLTPADAGVSQGNLRLPRGISGRSDCRQHDGRTSDATSNGAIVRGRHPDRGRRRSAPFEVAWPTFGRRAVLAVATFGRRVVWPPRFLASALFTALARRYLFEVTRF